MNLTGCTVTFCNTVTEALLCFVPLLVEVYWLKLHPFQKVMFVPFGQSPLTFCDSIIFCFSFYDISCSTYNNNFMFFFPSITDSVVDSPQLSPFNSKGPLCLSPSFQMSTLSLPGQAPSPLQSPILSEVGSTARLEEEEEGRRKVHCSPLPHNPFFKE